MIRDDDEQEFKFGDDHVGETNQFFAHKSGAVTREGEREVLERQARLELQQKQIDYHLLPSEVRDKARYGGNYLTLKESLKPNFTPFYVFVSGHIESG